MATRTRDGGYVTLAVLVVAGLLASAVSSLLLVSRPALGLARIGADQTIADGLLDGALQTAGYLLFPGKQPPDQVDDLRLRSTTGSVRFDVADESGRIDLNAATPELLAGLFTAAGGVSLDPGSFGGHVVDWRDQDDEKGTGGAESFDYEAAGLGYAPRNRPFRSVAELALLLGLSRADFERLQPHLTVFSGSASVDPLSASRTVLRAVPQMLPAEIERLLKARQARPVDQDAISAAIAAHGEFLRAEPSGVYRLRLDAQLQTGYSSSVEAIVIKPRDETTDFGVVAWARMPRDPRR